MAKKQDGRGQSANSKKALEESRESRIRKGKDEKKLMQLNIRDYEDYLYRMSKLKKMTVTKYILSLISKDKEENKAIYDVLKTISDFDKKERISPNRGKRFKREEI